MPYGKHPYYETPTERDRRSFEETLTRSLATYGTRKGTRVLPDGTVEEYEVIL